jgi:hypothetical protein
MNTKRIIALASSLFLVCLMAMPALAGLETGIAVIQGTAQVGNSIGGGAIPQTGQCTPTGKGLHTPSFHGGSKNEEKTGMFQVNKEVYYRLNSESTAIVADSNGTVLEDLGEEYEGRLDVCGIVGPGLLGIGAACGVSVGRDGRGKLIVSGLTNPEIVRIYQLDEVGWPTAVGGVLPVSGYITRVNANKSVKFTSKGRFTAEISASGAAPCFEAKPGGGRNFTVVGTMRWAMYTKPAGGKPHEPKLSD